jgi:hypothetical protein
MDYKDHPSINQIAKVVGIHSHLKLVMGCATANLFFPRYVSNLFLKAYKFQLQMILVNLSIYPNNLKRDFLGGLYKKFFIEIVGKFSDGFAEFVGAI